MRMIDADALIDDLMERYCKECNKRKGIKNGKYRIIYEIGEAPCRACEVDDVKAELEEAPTADVPERNVGEWIITEHHSNYDDWDDYTCPFCRKTFSRIYGARFCPSCGARLFDKDTNVPGKGESNAAD